MLVHLCSIKVPILMRFSTSKQSTINWPKTFPTVNNSLQLRSPSKVSSCPSSTISPATIQVLARKRPSVLAPFQGTYVSHTAGARITAWTHFRGASANQRMTVRTRRNASAPSWTASVTRIGAKAASLTRIKGMRHSWLLCLRLRGRICARTYNLLWGSDTSSYSLQDLHCVMSLLGCLQGRGLRKINLSWSTQARWWVKTLLKSKWTKL